MVRVDIEGIIMTGGPIPVPSVVVLRERAREAMADAPRRALSIQIGSFEAAGISYGIDRTQVKRPVAHDLMLSLVEGLGAKVERVEIDRVDAPVFFASVVLLPAGEGAEEIRVDARPSDALALAVRANAPVYVEDDVMNRAGDAVTPVEADPSEEIEQFDEFVKTLSPDDF